MRKYKLISALAEETAKEVVRNEENWREQLENDMIIKLHKYAAMKGYSFDKVYYIKQSL